MRIHRRRARRAGVRADGRRQDGGRRIRHRGGLRRRRQVLLHHADQGAEQPEVPRPRGRLRRGEGRPAHRRRLPQRRRRRGGHDHRGTAQHAVRGVADAAATHPRRHGRDPLPRGPGARAGVGGGHPQPRRVGAAGGLVGDGVELGGVRQLAFDGARPHGRGGHRSSAGAPVAAHAHRAAPLPDVRGRRHRGEQGPHGRRPAGRIRLRRRWPGRRPGWFAGRPAFVRWPGRRRQPRGRARWPGWPWRRSRGRPWWPGRVRQVRQAPVEAARAAAAVPAAAAG